jgi:hypothetical protein
MKLKGRGSVFPIMDHWILWLYKMDTNAKIKKLSLSGKRTLAMKERMRHRKGLLDEKFGNSEKSDFSLEAIEEMIHKLAHTGRSSKLWR